MHDVMWLVECLHSPPALILGAICCLPSGLFFSCASHLHHIDFEKRERGLP